MKHRQDHVLTEAQATRIGIPAGTIVQVEMYTEDEIQRRIKTIPEIRGIAKCFYLDGQLAGKNLNLGEPQGCEE